MVDLRDARGVTGVPLLIPIWRDGERLYEFDAERARQRAAESLGPLPDEWFLPPGPEEVPMPVIGPALAAEAEATRRRFAGG